MSFLCTDKAFARLDSTGNPVAIAIAIHFEIESYRPGSPATRTNPADAAEYEFAVTLVELDGEPETPGPLTDDERVAALVWFLEHGHDEACDLVDAPDDEADPDDARDRQIDEDMHDRWAA